MRALLLVTGVPILFLLLMRVLTPRPPNAFRRFRVAGVRPESSTVTSFELVPADRKPVPVHAPGQFVAIRVNVDGERQLRSYSLSCSPRRNSCRISVKREPGGRVSEHLHARLAVGDVVEIGAPAGRFVLGADSDQRPVVLISAGIGVTPVFAMLEALAEQRSTREVWWIHGARNGAEHALRAEARGHVALLDHGHSHVRYSRPQPDDRLGRDYDEPGRISGAAIIALGVPADADFRLCGPTRFVADVIAGLVEHGVARERIDSRELRRPARARRARGAYDPPTAPRSPSRAPASRRLGTRASPACSTSPRPTPSPRARAVASAPATAAAPTCCRAASATTPSRSSRPRPAAPCCAARSPSATSCSTPDDRPARLCRPTPPPIIHRSQTEPARAPHRSTRCSSENARQLRRRPTPRPADPLTPTTDPAPPVSLQHGAQRRLAKPSQRPF